MHPTCHWERVLILTLAGSLAGFLVSCRLPLKYVSSSLVLDREALVGARWANIADGPPKNIEEYREHLKDVQELVVDGKHLLR